ncbi:MAG: hypothetical protein IH868_05660 [Chloroflexi bacterium]|nr:hypothetical protein [Chloroflexota bacterium]
MVRQQPGVAYSLTIRAEYENDPGMLGELTSAIGNADGSIDALDVVNVRNGRMTRDITVLASDVDHGNVIIEAVRKIAGVKVINVSDPTFLAHLQGKIEVHSRVPVETRNDLSMAYTPGVGRVCMAIYDQPEAVWTLTSKAHTVAVVTDGTAVLGLGDIGPEAAMPVMEGKAVLFKEFGGVDAWPICLNTKDPDEIVSIVKAISPGFGGINLEDISAPRCFEIEERLKKELDIPVFHDDQHGTAVVVLAGLINALKVVGKDAADIKVIMAGVGAAGTACAKVLMGYGVKSITGFDRSGALSRDRLLLYPSDFPIPSATIENPFPAAPRVTLPAGGIDFDSVVTGLELDLLRQALRRSGGNKKRAADLLGIKRTTFTAKLRSLETVEEKI